MDMRVLLIKLCVEFMQIGSSLLIAIVQRYLFGLATFEQDVRWLSRFRACRALMNAKWYRGRELFHQIRGSRILGTV